MLWQISIKFLNSLSDVYSMIIIIFLCSILCSFHVIKTTKDFFVCLFVLFRIIYLFAFANKAQLQDQETYRKCITVTLAWLLHMHLSWKVKQPCFLTTMHKCLNLSNSFFHKNVEGYSTLSCLRSACERVYTYSTLRGEHARNVPGAYKKYPFCQYYLPVP